jgi:hypothetical protein
MIRVSKLFLLLAIFLCLSFSSHLRADTSEKTINVDVGPLGLLVGALSLGVDIKIGETSWTVGPELLYWDTRIGDYNFKASGFGVRADWYADRPALTEGWYVGPFARYSSWKVTYTNSNGSTGDGSANGLLLGAIGGYHWFWDNFNIRLGLGYGLNTATKTDIHYSDGTRSDSTSANVGGLTGEFDFGLAF